MGNTPQTGVEFEIQTVQSALAPILALLSSLGGRLPVDQLQPECQ
jgi:hypothetical protein